MRPREAPASTTDDLFRARLLNIIDPRHALVRLAALIDWQRFEIAFGPLYAEVGRPGKPTRLMVGLHLLKHLHNLSDEVVCERWIENPYYQHFCGFAYFQHALPIDRSSLTRWRERIGPAGMEVLLAATVEAGLEAGAVAENDLKRVTVDTTVQPKAVAHPSDARLYHRGREILVRLAKKHGLALRQSYRRLGKRALRKAGAYLHARQNNRAKREIRRLKTYLGRVARDIARKIAGNAELEQRFAAIRRRVERLLAQQRHDRNKLYSLHAPEVECLAKGKAHKKYEFGVKVSIAAANRSGFVLGTLALPGNPYDGHTLDAAARQVERLTGTPIERLYVDRGYRGHNHPHPDRVFISGQRRGITPTICKELRRRSAIEPVIGHMKEDGRLGRNHLLGTFGDAVNAILCGVGYNLRLLRNWLRYLLALFLAALCAP
ncbi:MAG TPA: IS5 family transposase [Stellaceae bacterium]|jgi:IS5 family transposase|nr:IS5 family transposase [Stellaceae bacterium]